MSLLDFTGATLTALAGVAFTFAAAQGQDKPPHTQPARPAAESARLLPGKYNGSEPTVAADPRGGIVVAAMHYYRPAIDAAPVSRVVCWRSADGGKKWFGPEPLRKWPDEYGSQFDPWLQQDGRGRFYAAYLAAQEKKSDGIAPVFQRSDDGGRTWNAPTVLGRNADKTVLAISPNRKRLLLTFTPMDQPRPLVRLSRSDDQGKSWHPLGPPVVPNRASYICQGLAVNNEGGIAAGWTVQAPGPKSGNRLIKLLLTLTADGGATWTEVELARFQPKQEDGAGGTLHSYALGALTLDGSGVVHAAFLRPGERAKVDVMICSTKDFRTVSDPVKLSEDDASSLRGYPAVVASANRVHVAWVERQGEVSNVWYRGSGDGGKTWCSRLRVSNPERPTELLNKDGFKLVLGDYISLAEDGRGAVHVVWDVGKSRSELRGEIWHSIVAWSGGE
jgi:hypothetical protein